MASSQVNRIVPTGSASRTPPQELVKKLRAIWRNRDVHFVLRMDRWAEDDYIERSRMWLHSMGEVSEEYGPLSRRLSRWLHVAGLLALCGDKVINYEVLRMARDIAVDGHDHAAKALKELARVLEGMVSAGRSPHRIH